MPDAAELDAFTECAENLAAFAHATTSQQAAGGFDPAPAAGPGLFGGKDAAGVVPARGHLVLAASSSPPGWGRVGQQDAAEAGAGVGNAAGFAGTGAEQQQVQPLPPAGGFGHGPTQGQDGLPHAEGPPGGPAHIGPGAGLPPPPEDEVLRALHSLEHAPVSLRLLEASGICGPVALLCGSSSQPVAAQAERVSGAWRSVAAAALSHATAALQGGPRLWPPLMGVGEQGVYHHHQRW